MTQHPPTDRWRFTLGRLFFATTTIAMALGALRSPLPNEVSLAIATCVPMFWTGVAAVTFGSALVTSESITAQTVGEIVVLTGFALAIAGSLVGFFVALIGMLALIFYVVSWFGT